MLSKLPPAFKKDRREFETLFSKYDLYWIEFTVYVVITRTDLQYFSVIRQWILFIGE